MLHARAPVLQLRWPLAVLALGLLVAGALLPRAAGAQDKPKARPVYRCENKGTATFSDSPQRCPEGQAVVHDPRPASGAAPTITKIDTTSLPCPEAVADPEGPAWASLQACYGKVLDGQAPQVAAEAQLAGVAMAQCDVETRQLANASTHVAELGAKPADRRLAIRRWAQWLVRRKGIALDSLQVDVVKIGKPALVSRLSGPTEMQTADGQVSEAVNGTRVQLGSQLHLRPGVSLLLGSVPVPARGRDSRCVRLD
jgi:hypothetical protein